MKKLVLLIAIGVGAWWYFIGGRTMTESDVRKYYSSGSAAFLQRKPDAICDLLDDKFQGSFETSYGGRRETLSMNKEKTCAHYKLVFEQFEAIGQRLGGMVQLDYNFDIDEIKLSPDKKSAIVETSYTLNVAGKLMRVRGSSTDTLIRRNGKVVATKSDSFEQTLQ